MGMAMGEDPTSSKRSCGWVKEVAKIPVWAKMTPNVGNPTVPAGGRAARRRRRHQRRSTRSSRVVGVDLKTLRPMPTVEGHTRARRLLGPGRAADRAAPGDGDRARAIPNVPISGMGGIETGVDAAQFILLGASHRAGLHRRDAARLRDHRRAQGRARRSSWPTTSSRTSRDFVGKSLPYFTTHADLVARQKAAKAERAGATQPRRRDLEGRHRQGDRFAHDELRTRT